MPNDEARRPVGLPGSPAWFGVRAASPGRMLVWRVRVWLFAVAVGLIVANLDGDGARLAQRSAGSQARCQVPATRQHAATAPRRPAPKDCADPGVPLDPADL